MSEDDFDDDGFARPPRPLRPKGKRVKIHQHSQHTVVEFDGPYGPIHIESSTTITVEVTRTTCLRIGSTMASPNRR